MVLRPLPGPVTIGMPIYAEARFISGSGRIPTVKQPVSFVSLWHDPTKLHGSCCRVTQLTYRINFAVVLDKKMTAF